MTRYFGVGRYLLGLMLVIGGPLQAQRRPQLEVAPPLSAGGGGVVTATNLFADAEMRDLVRSGFPASLRYRVELWRVGGLFNDLEGREEWLLVVQYDPSAQRYRVVRQQNNKIDDLGSFATLSTTQTLLERPIRTTVAPERQGTRYYYALSLDVEALSVSDMDQLNRWLRGVRGSTAASAFGNGVRTLMLRMLGGEKRHFEARSGTIVAP